MPDKRETSPLTLNRLSVYLRCLRSLEAQGVKTVSSADIAVLCHLSPAQIRKDLTHFGEFGVRGVGYQVDQLADRLHGLLGLHVQHRLVIVGMGNLGSALARYFGFNDKSFQVVAGVDEDPECIGREVGAMTVQDVADLQEVVATSGAEIGVIAVPPEAAEQALVGLAQAGIRAVLNFAPIALKAPSGVRLRNVDMRVHLEEVSFFLSGELH